MDLAALPPGRSFSSARSRQRTLTHSPADTHLVASPKPAAPSSQLGSAGRALPSGPALGQQGRGAPEGAAGGRAPLGGPSRAPRTVPGGGCSGERGASSRSGPPSSVFSSPVGRRRGSGEPRAAPRLAAGAGRRAGPGEAGRGALAARGWTRRAGPRANPAPEPAPTPDWPAQPRGAGGARACVSAIKAEQA